MVISLFCFQQKYYHPIVIKKWRKTERPILILLFQLRKENKMYNNTETRLWNIHSSILKNPPHPLFCQKKELLKMWKNIAHTPSNRPTSNGERFSAHTKNITTYISIIFLFSIIYIVVGTT